jgi:type II secretory pathway pseudopilin PulG
MNHRMHTRGRTQRGWSLLEAVVVVALMGTMAAGLWKSLELVEQNRRTEVSRDVVQQAEDALHGMLLRDNRLPQPDDFSNSTALPGHLEGWLPPGVLGTEAPRSIRYTVDSALVQAPTAFYQSDPLELLEPDELPPRTSFNGLDFCLQVIRREKQAAVGAGGLRFAFGVQQIDAADRADPTTQAFRLGTLSAANGGLGRANTRAVGLTEVVHRLGCIKSFARLAHEVRSTALARDLSDMGEVNAKFRHLGVLSTEESIINSTWRIANASVRLAVSTWSLAVTIVTLNTTPVALLTVTPTLAGFALEFAMWGLLLEMSAERLAAAQEGLPLARQAYDEALNFSEALKAQYAWHLGRAASFQGKGLMP